MLYRFVSYLYLYCFCKGSSTHEAACCSTVLFFWPLIVFCKLCEHQACASACSHFIIFQLSSCQRQHIEYLLTWSFLFLAAVPTVTHNCSHVLHWFTCFSTFTFYPLLTFHPFPQATNHPSAVWWQDSARKTTWALQASTCLATSWRPRMAPSTCKARFNLSQKAGREPLNMKQTVDIAPFQVRSPVHLQKSAVLSRIARDVQKQAIFYLCPGHQHAEHAKSLCLSFCLDVSLWARKVFGTLRRCSKRPNHSN